MRLLFPFVDERYLPLSQARGSNYQRLFLENFYVVLPEFFKPWIFSLLRDEAKRLSSQTIRRDIYVPESQSWRHMATLGSLKLAELSSIIPHIYYSEDLLEFLSGVAGEKVLPVPDINEQYVLNFLQREGDFQGAHVDTYAFAFNIIIDTPPQGSGGTVQILDKTSEQVQGRVPVREIQLLPNYAYFMRTDVLVHAVSPVCDGSHRIIFNMAYKTHGDVTQRSYSSSQLYG